LHLHQRPGDSSHGQCCCLPSSEAPSRAVNPTARVSTADPAPQHRPGAGCRHQLLPWGLPASAGQLLPLPCSGTAQGCTAGQGPQPRAHGASGESWNFVETLVPISVPYSHPTTSNAQWNLPPPPPGVCIALLFSAAVPCLSSSHHIAPMHFATLLL
jgi:hypothetical protein